MRQNYIRPVTTRNRIRPQNVRLVVDTSRFIFGETPAGSLNSSNVVFTTANAYVSGTLQVWRDQLTMHPTDDFSETDANAGTLTMVVAPDSNEKIIVNYIKQ